MLIVNYDEDEDEDCWLIEMKNMKICINQEDFHFMDHVKCSDKRRGCFEERISVKCL